MDAIPQDPSRHPNRTKEEKGMFNPHFTGIEFYQKLGQENYPARFKQ